MKQLTKGQMRIVITLNLVIVALLCGLFFMHPLGESPVGADPADETHDIYRNARVSLNVDLDFETNFGGSQDEELVAAFASSDQTKIHIFGNTLSDDYDFTQKQGDIFFLTTDRKGKIERITTFGAEGDRVRKVIIAEGGYLLAIDNILSKSTHLLQVNSAGIAVQRLLHASTSDEFVSDLILMENGYLFIVQSGISSMNFYDIKVLFYGLDYSEQGATVLHNASYNQEYVAVYPKGLDKYVMAVNYKSELWNGMSIIEFSKASNQYVKIQLENNYSAHGFMPVSGGYAALIIDSENRPSLITVSSSGYSLKEKKYLTSTASYAKMFFANSNYYVYLHNSETSSMLKFDMSLQSSNEIAAFKQAGLAEKSYVRGDGIMFACGGTTGSLVALSSSQNLSKSFGSDGEETNACLVFLGNDTFYISESNAQGKDIGGNYGDKDIWLTKVSI